MTISNLLLMKKDTRYKLVNRLYGNGHFRSMAGASSFGARKPVIMTVIIFLMVIFSGVLVKAFQEDTSIMDAEVKVNALSAIIIDAGTNRVFYEKNADTRLQPASTVKLMTALVAIERMSLGEYVIPTETILNVEPTVCGLKPGIAYKLKDLISAILIKSANDAAVAIAEAVAGSEENFVGMMNAKAREIGMNNTNFTSSSGLPADPRESQYTTSRDLAALMRYAKKYPVILEEMAKTKAYIAGEDGKKLFLKTHNKSLYKDDRAVWGKTGYTKKARRTFVGVDPSDDPRIIIALLKSRDLWDDIAELKAKGLYLYENTDRSMLGKFKEWIRSGN